MTVPDLSNNYSENLNAPVKSFRIFALEDIIKSGSKPELLEKLQKAKEIETDAECLMLIEHALIAVKSRLSPSSSQSETVTSVDDFLTRWNSLDNAKKMRALINLPSRLPKNLKSRGPELFANETDPVICAKIIRVFCRYWPTEKLPEIATLALSSESLVVKLAALRSIVHIKPELLESGLSELLNAKDPQIKALSIRALTKIDTAEALKHLQELLLSSEMNDRLAAIQNCTFLPFETVKPVLLKYFSVENCPELLIRAGWILEMNPDLQVPFKLFELAERSPAKKSALIKEIMTEAVNVLEKSGILGNKFKAYTAKLQAWINKRNAVRFVRQAVARLSSDINEPELDKKIIAHLKNSHVRTAFKDALQWPVSEEVKSKICSILDKKSLDPAAFENKVVENDSKEPSANKSQDANKILPAINEIEKEASARLIFNETSDTQLLEIFASMDLDQANKLDDQFNDLFSSNKQSAAIRSAAFDCLVRLKKSGFEDTAISLINSSEMSLAISAVNYLGIVDPEKVFPYIGKCLKMADVRMKSAALSILKDFDFNQAVSSLSVMLKSRTVEQQKMALECMEKFDFALIRDELTEYLTKVDNSELFEIGLCHFAANPSSENSYSLFKIEKSQSQSRAKKAKELRLSLVDETTDEIISDEQSLNEKYEEEKKQKVKPAWAYKKNKTEIEDISNLRRTIETIKYIFASKGSWIAFAAIAFFAIGFYYMFTPSGEPPTRSRDGAIKADRYIREGTVKRIAGTAIKFESTRGEIFVMHPGSDGYKVPPVGQKLRVSLVPYRRNPNNVFTARIRALREISEFSPEEEVD